MTGHMHMVAVVGQDPRLNYSALLPPPEGLISAVHLSCLQSDRRLY